MNWLTTRLVPDWRSSWRWWSVQLHAAATLCLTVLQVAPVLPPQVQALIPQPWGMIITAAWAVLGVAVRVVAQRPKGPPNAA